MHPGEMMARLNPATVRYDIGRGGMPQLTPQDIAAAIAWVPEGLGRELMCRLWWPEGAALKPEALDNLITGMLLEEWIRRADVLTTAQLRVEYAKSEWDRRRARAAVEEAQALQWPRIGGPNSPYTKIREAVLAEMSSDCLCPACRGRAFLISEGKRVDCRFCDKTGRAKVSDRARAEAIGVNRETYRTSVAPVYQWLLDRCTDALAPAREHFTEALA